MNEIEKKGALWWPKFDYHCKLACDGIRPDIIKAISYCRKFRTVIQAGGNVGVWPLELAATFKTVITFEPDATNYACLRANTSRIRNILPYNMGLSDKKEKVDLYREADNCGAHYVKGSGNIELITIDSLNIKDCDLLQLDIEGYEYMARIGALKTIKESKPVIVCEEKGLGKKYKVENDTISKLLLGLGYKISDKMGRDVLYTV